jgi:hypothetical protein
VAGLLEALAEELLRLRRQLVGVVKVTVRVLPEALEHVGTRLEGRVRVRVRVRVRHAPVE